MSIPVLETVTISVDAHIATVRLNRPEKMNAMNLAMWHDIRSAFRYVDDTPEIRVAVLEGEGKAFTAGIDLQMMMGLGQQIQNDCDGRMRESLRRVIFDLQDTLTSLERCRKPVLAAVHGACVGGGIDLITCADMRYCSADAWFSVKEIDIGMTADVGTLQRMPKIIADGLVRELAYTGRNMDAEEAREVGFVNRVFENREAMMREVTAIAKSIAAKAPLAVRGTKEMLLYSRDHSVTDGLNYIATWNAAMMSQMDLQAGIEAQMNKTKAVYED